ncbi:MAG: single-stranded DNA-binding protein [Bacteroidota bacterium]
MNLNNHIQLIGQLIDHPVYITTEKGADLTTFLLKTKRCTDQPSNTTSTDIHRCVSWGPAALLLHEHLAKGCRLAVRGQLQYSEVSEDGNQPVIIPEIHLSDFTFLD